jgi:hypothetical protein
MIVKKFPDVYGTERLITILKLTYALLTVLDVFILLTF